MKINISFCFDKNYYRQAIVAISSLFLNAKKNKNKIHYNLGIYDYSTFESAFAKEFNIPKRSLKKYLEPNYDYQNSGFAKDVIKVYKSNL